MRIDSERPTTVLTFYEGLLWAETV